VIQSLRRQLFALALGSAFVLSHDVAAQQLGYKVLGSAGITAGVEPPPGLYVISRFMQYSADELRTRSGSVAAIDGLDIDAFAGLEMQASPSFLDRLDGLWQDGALATLDVAASAG